MIPKMEGARTIALLNSRFIMQYAVYIRIPNCPTISIIYQQQLSHSDTQKLREPLEEPARALGIDLLEESAEICHAAAGELLRRLALAHGRHDVAGLPGSAMGFHHGMPMVSWAKTMERVKPL